MLRRTAALGAALAAATPALAHEGHEAAATLPRWQPWDTVFAVVLVVAVSIYTRGVRRLWRSPVRRLALEPWRIGAFALGWLALAVALASPLDPLADALFSAHMTQHELLMLVAAPLFVVARPGSPLLWALAWHRRERLAVRLRRPKVRATWRALTRPVVVFALLGLALWVWHAPVLFEAALRNQAIHAVQHAMLFWTAVLFWYAHVHGRDDRIDHAGAGPFVFLTALHSGVLGALLTWAPSVWYRTYDGRTDTFGLTALRDQQLAGLIILVPAGALCVVVGLACLAARLGDAENRGALERTAGLGDGSRDASDVG